MLPITWLSCNSQHTWACDWYQALYTTNQALYTTSHMPQLQLSTLLRMWAVSSSLRYQSSSAHYQSICVQFQKLAPRHGHPSLWPLSLSVLHQWELVPWCSFKEKHDKDAAFFLIFLQKSCQSTQKTVILLLYNAARYSALSFCPAKRFAMCKSDPLSL